jgi:hypothetical protein
MNMTQQRPESKELSILIKLLKMTTSTHDHEAISAMRLANAQVLKLGTDWEDLLYGKVTLVADPFTSIPDVTPAPPPASSVSTPTPPRRPPPPPPKPTPVYFRDAATIQPLFDSLMFVTLTPQYQQRVNILEKMWIADKRLESGDYSELQGIVRSYCVMPKQKKRRRRT